MNQLEQLIFDHLQVLEPTELEIINESHHHIGHAAHNQGASHFRVIISSPKFQGLTKVAQQRLVFQQLQDVMPFPIHALALVTKIPS
jgi:BolA protein